MKWIRSSGNGVKFWEMGLGWQKELINGFNSIVKLDWQGNGDGDMGFQFLGNGFDLEMGLSFGEWV